LYWQPDGLNLTSSFYMRGFYFLICWLLIGLIMPKTSLAQGRYMVGTAIDAATGRGIDRATVVNQRTRQRARTNVTGRFFLTALPGDSLILTSYTHNRTGIKWDGADNPMVVCNRQPIPTDRIIELDEVTVTAKRYEEVKEEIRKLLNEPTASAKVTGEQVFDRLADGAGLTLMYEAWSKRAKSDRKAGVVMQEYRRHTLAMERLRIIVDQATRYTGDEADRFMTFCNFDDDFLLRTSDYDLIWNVLESQKQFKLGTGH
jgi:hypothetical protein